MITCECDNTFGNTGKPSCDPIFAQPHKAFLVPKYGSDGTLNFIDLTETLNAAYFAAKINAADPLDRWYPLPTLKNFNGEKGDATYETFDDDTKSYVRDGIRSVSALIPKSSEAYMSKLATYTCQEFGMFMIDKRGNLKGMLNAVDELYPLLIDNESWNVRTAWATGTTNQNLMLAFDIHPDEQEENLRMILASDITPVNLLSLQGLLDVSAEYTDIDQTIFTVTFTTDFGSAIDPQVVKGLIAANFTLYNVTDSLAVTIIAMTEISDGTYTVTYASQTLGDVLRLTGTKAGYDFTDVNDDSIQIPVS